MSTNRFRAAFLALALVTLSLLPTPALAETVRLAVHFLDVGQGDSILVQSPEGKRVLIDGGPPKAAHALVARLKALGVDKLDLVVITHPDADHIGGLDEVATAIPIAVVLDPMIPDASPMYEKLLKTFVDLKVPVKQARRGRQVQLGQAKLQLLAPPEPLIRDSRSDTNANSVVIRLDYGDVKVLLTGDSEEETEQFLLRSGVKELQAGVLKVAHHGSAHSTTDSFLRAVSPQVAVISCSKTNRYGHPAPDTMSRLRGQGAEIFVTAEEGEILLLTDGRKLEIKTGTRTWSSDGRHSAAVQPPKPAEPERPTPTKLDEPTAPAFVVDLNRADAAQLASLPGIGETLAQRIVEHRAAHGPFKRVEELDDVQGIGPKILRSLTGLVTVGGASN